MTSPLSITPVLPRPAFSWLDFLVAAIFFSASVIFFTRHNDFPFYYHPDEPGKVRQLIEGDLNFNHPLLLLQGSKLIAQVSGAESSLQKNVQAGRLASAIFSAIAIASLVLVASSLQSTLAGVGVGLLLLFNPHVFELAHYMKEDPAYACGVALFFLAVVWCWMRPSLDMLAFLGVGAGLALSGKYLGAIFLPVGLWCAWAIPGCRKRNLGVFLLSFALVVFLINFPLLSHWATFSGSFEREVGYAVHGHRGITRSVPHGVYGAVFREATNPFIWILLIIYVVGVMGIFIRREQKISQGEIALAAFPLVYALLLSFFPKTHHRYFLPATMAVCCLAGIAAARFRFRKFPLGFVLLAGAVILSAKVTAESYAAFQTDGRSALVSYIQKNLPSNAVIIEDSRVGLPHQKNPRYAEEAIQLTQEIKSKLFAADLGSIEALRAQGVVYVAVSEGAYGRFLLKSQKPNPEDAAEYQRRRDFYEQLFREGKLLWSCEAGRIPYLSPSLRLYSIESQNEN